MNQSQFISTMDALTAWKQTTDHTRDNLVWILKTTHDRPVLHNCFKAFPQPDPVTGNKKMNV